MEKRNLCAPILKAMGWNDENKPDFGETDLNYDVDLRSAAALSVKCNNIIAEAVNKMNSERFKENDEEVIEEWEVY